MKDQTSQLKVLTSAADTTSDDYALGITVHHLKPEAYANRYINKYYLTHVVSLNATRTYTGETQQS